MAIQVIDNFLDKDCFNKIKTSMTGNYFPWFYCDYVSHKDEKDKFYFVHNFYKDSKPQSPFFTMLDNLLNKLEIKSLIRVKGNLQVKEKKMTYNNFHADLPYKHKGCIFSLNTCDGATILEDGTEIKSVANRALLFNPEKLHSSTSTTNVKARLNVNINYF